MNKVLKIVLIVLGALIVLGVIIIAVLYFVFQGLQNTARDIYEGPIPHNVVAIGLDMEPKRLVISMDMDNQLALMLMEMPPAKTENPPFSEPDVKKELAALKEDPTLAAIIEGYESGQAADIYVDDQMVRTWKYANQGQRAEAGVLNLDKHRMLFVGIGENTMNLPDALLKVPVIRNDSHLKPEEKTQPSGQEAESSNKEYIPTQEVAFAGF